MPIAKPDPHHDAVTDRWRDLAAIGAGIIPAKLGTCPEPDDFDAIREDLDLLCRQVDRLVLAYGEYVNNRTGRKVDLSLFTNQLRDALDGNALYEIEEAKQDIRDQMNEQNADDQYDAWRDAKMEDVR